MIGPDASPVLYVSQQLTEGTPPLQASVMSDTTPHHTAFRDLALFLALVAWAGVIFLTSYYNEFGLRYSDLNFDYYHVLFRGLSTIFLSPWGLLTATATLICLLMPIGTYHLNLGLKVSVLSVQRAVILLSFAAMFLIADNNGFAESQRDGTPGTTSLREVTLMQSADGTTLPVFTKLTTPVSGVARRVFIVTRSGSQLKVIAPPAMATAGASHPKVTTIFLKSGDFYEDRTSNNHRNFWRALF